MRKLLYLLASAAVMAGGCSEKKETPAGEGCGTIRIACEAETGTDDLAAMCSWGRFEGNKPVEKGDPLFPRLEAKKN